MSPGVMKANDFMDAELISTVTGGVFLILSVPEGNSRNVDGNLYDDQLSSGLLPVLV